MASMQDSQDYDEADLSIEKPKTHAAGITAVAVSMKRSLERMGPTRTAKSLLKLNQAEGFDCMSCGWPDPDPGHRHVAEFCENGAKSVAEESTARRATPELFAKYSIDDLSKYSEYWLGQQGRITHPMVKRSGGTHYEPIDWDEAFTLIGEQLKALEPDEATFYTSGRASNESAFAYQLFVRAYGTNNLPDCSNMCHESTSFALQEAIGIGKASVVLQDVYDAELIIIAGQNPGTNHPRMLSALEKAKQNGAKIIAINPLREAGLINFKNPQTPRGMVGPGTKIEDLHLPVRINGDLALFKAFGKLLVEWDALDHDFVDKHTNNFDMWKQHVSEVDWDEVETVTGLSRAQITEAAQMLRESKATVFCWAMGITQHHNSVNTIKEITNLALAQGNIGKAGAGLFPVRGHSNVQGDRTMGIWERVPKHFLDAMQKEFGFDPPRENGLDTIDSIRGMRDGKVHFFLGLGGNFAQAAPDHNITFDAMRKTKMTVHISTKINRSHLVAGDVALILPVRGRSEKDIQASGPQWISVEDSTCSVHASRGPLDPPSPLAKSEVDIITRIAEATIGDRYDIDWKAMRDDYRNIREHISRVVPGCESYEVNARRPGGFVLPHPPRDSRTFQTTSGLAEFFVTPIDALHVPPKHLLLQTFRSHDQFNTTIYGLSDRYRGIEGGRKVIFVNRDDIAELGFRDGDFVDITTKWDDDDVARVAENFRIVEYNTPKGSAAAYYPETNVLVPLDSSATDSNCPTSKSIVVTLSPAHTGAPSESTGGQDEMRSDEGHKTQTEPEHLS